MIIAVLSLQGIAVTFFLPMYTPVIYLQDSSRLTLLLLLQLVLINFITFQ